MKINWRIVCITYILIQIVFLGFYGTLKCHSSESPQRDLYKIDSRDWYFNHKGDYSINQPEYNVKSKESDGDRLLNELNQVSDKNERNMK